MHKRNFISACKKSSSFSSPVCRKLTNAEVYYVKISYIKFCPNQTQNVECLDVNSSTYLKEVCQLQLITILSESLITQ